jgi:hypothetical protein
MIVYNEEYAFLAGYPDPPAGWFKMPQKEPRGGAWEVVPNDTFDGQVYYRQRLMSQAATPENFTVLVGERWVATLQTRDYSEIAFYAGFRNEVPPFLRGIVPYRLVWKLLMGETEAYIGALEHETFHAFQGQVAPARLAEAEMSNRVGGQYPWDDPTLRDAWQAEMSLLVHAVRANSEVEALELVRQFLAQRNQRRLLVKLSQDLMNYERQREWLEGLGKYVELSIQRLAARTSNYQPLPDLASDPDFKKYTTREQFWSQQIGQAQQTMGLEGETHFYYGGLAQAALLDRLLPSWKQQAFNPEVMLEDLLKQALQ